MSEKIYVALLRLHSSRFREEYGAEALQLFRDRCRDERGFSARLRLWVDLLADLAVSVPPGYGYCEPNLVGAPAQHDVLDGLPSFHVLGDETPSGGALLCGLLLSVFTLAVFPVSLGHSGDHRSPTSPIVQPLRATYERWFAQQPKGQSASVAESIHLNSTERRRVIQAVISNLRKYYVDPPIAQKVADTLLAFEKRGGYDTVTERSAFAELLTTQLRDVSHDKHLDVLYSQNPLPDRPPGPTPEGLERYREEMKRVNCTIEKVEILQPNIGYLKLNSFPDVSVCEATATAAMASINNADAIIFDLRDNGGGYPTMVMQIAAYLFDHPEYLYNPRENTTQQSWTRSPVPGNKLADKPVYVLVSTRTASGAEQFCYNLKMTKRATLVGETTRGNAHSGVFHRIDEHFGMGITETRPINPYSEKDWEGTGVKPDIQVQAANAFETAKRLAEKHR